jgi:hypothetical protein
MRCDATMVLTISDEPVTIRCVRDEPHVGWLHSGDAYAPGATVAAFTVSWPSSWQPNGSSSRVPLPPDVIGAVHRTLKEPW